MTHVTDGTIVAYQRTRRVCTRAPEPNGSMNTIVWSGGACAEWPQPPTPSD